MSCPGHCRYDGAISTHRCTAAIISANSVVPRRYIIYLYCSRWESSNIWISIEVLNYDFYHHFISTIIANLNPIGLEWKWKWFHPNVGWILPHLIKWLWHFYSYPTSLSSTLCIDCHVAKWRQGRNQHRQSFLWLIHRQYVIQNSYCF